MSPLPSTPYEPDSPGVLRILLPWVIGLLLIGAIGWFLYSQITASGVGIMSPAKPAQEVNLLPPPPPPPPPPEIKEKPPEPTEQPQPAPSEAPKAAAAPEAAPVTIDAPAQAGGDSFGLKSGSGSGIGSPGSQGTCLGTNCSPGGNGQAIGLYTRYLTSAVQDKVEADTRLSRAVFLARVSLTVSKEGCITGVKVRSSSGINDADIARLVALLNATCGLNPPPPGMVFPQIVEIGGRKSSF